VLSFLEQGITVLFTLKEFGLTVEAQPAEAAAQVEAESEERGRSYAPDDH
jgi:hypothetical protein